ncbi:MAG: thymidylate kinase [Methanobacteriaceae archaeon]|nr:thymidylate kinase [Methanobacteriaceae archaeon]
MRFIVVDGLDGSGKSTHAQMIREKYLQMGENVILREHPSPDNPYGLKAKKALLGRGKINKIKAALYYALDVIRSVRRYYGNGETLIMVRYLMGVTYLPLPLARLLYRIFTAALPTSDYMFFLDLEPEEALKRLLERDEEEMFENLEDLTQVRDKALQLVKDWHIINTAGSIGEVQQSINLILEELDATDGK